MAYNDWLIYFIVLNVVVLTQFQIIHHPDRCHNDVDKDSLIKMIRELQIEFSSDRQSTKDRIAQLEADFDTYRNESLEVQKTLEEKLKRLLQPNDCLDVLTAGNWRSDVYVIYPEGTAVRARCEMDIDNGGWTVFQRRFDGSVDFYRNWTDYREGFGNTNGEYWLGNRYIHHLTSNRTCQLRIELVSLDNIAAHAGYTNFSISDENDGFRLAIGDYYGNAGFDALAFHNGQQFSTWDRDQDASPSHNCASTHMGAWWFYKCQHSNLNGVYGRGDQKGVVWWKHTGSDIMKETTMMLRCNNTAI